MFLRKASFHFILWSVFIAIALYLNTIIMFNGWAIIFKSIVNISILAMGFYINLTILVKRFLEERKTRIYVILVCGLILFVCTLRYAFDYAWFFNYIKDSQKGYLKAYWASLILSTLAIVSSANGIYFMSQTFENRERELLLKNEKLKAEMSFLLAQVNPHFLFNALNNIYSLAFTNSGDTSRYILKLSSLMQYMIYEGSELKVYLQSELDYISNYIDLQQLKSEHKQNIKLTINGNYDNIEVPPLLFIPFIENAVNYGNVLNGGFINVEMKILKDTLEFDCINSIASKPSVTKTKGGIGLSNVKKRLELIYGKNFSLLTQINQNVFIVKLCIPKM